MKSYLMAATALQHARFHLVAAPSPYRDGVPWLDYMPGPVLQGGRWFLPAGRRT